MLLASVGVRTQYDILRITEEEAKSKTKNKF